MRSYVRKQQDTTRNIFAVFLYVPVLMRGINERHSFHTACQYHENTAKTQLLISHCAAEPFCKKDRPTPRYSSEAIWFYPLRLYAQVVSIAVPPE